MRWLEWNPSIETSTLQFIANVKLKHRASGLLSFSFYKFVWFFCLLVSIKVKQIPLKTLLNPKHVTSLWDSIPSFELNIRLSSIQPKWFWIYQRWFIRGL